MRLYLQELTLAPRRTGGALRGSHAFFLNVTDVNESDKLSLFEGVRDRRGPVRGDLYRRIVRILPNLLFKVNVHLGAIGEW